MGQYNRMHAHQLDKDELDFFSKDWPLFAVDREQWKYRGKPLFSSGTEYEELRRSRIADIANLMNRLKLKLGQEISRTETTDC